MTTLEVLPKAFPTSIPSTISHIQTRTGFGSILSPETDNSSLGQDRVAQDLEESRIEPGLKGSTQDEHIGSSSRILATRRGVGGRIPKRPSGRSPFAGVGTGPYCATHRRKGVAYSQDSTPRDSDNNGTKFSPGDWESRFKPEEFVPSNNQRHHHVAQREIETDPGRFRRDRDARIIDLEAEQGICQRETEYYDRPETPPPPIVIRQRAPEPQRIIVRERSSSPRLMPQSIPQNQQQFQMSVQQQQQPQPPQNVPSRQVNTQPNFSEEDNAFIINLTARLMTQASEEQKSKRRASLQERMDPQIFQKYISQGQDPLLLYYRNQAINRLRAEKQARLAAQAAQQQRQNMPAAAPPMQQQRSMIPGAGLGALAADSQSRRRRDSGYYYSRGPPIERGMTRTPSPNGLGVSLTEALTGAEGPMTPRNDIGPFVFDGNTSRALDSRPRPSGGRVSERRRSESRISDFDAEEISSNSPSNRVNELATPSQKFGNMGWKTRKGNPMSQISSTISKDNTLGDDVRNAKLLAEFAKKHQRFAFGGEQAAEKSENLTFVSDDHQVYDPGVFNTDLPSREALHLVTHRAIRHRDSDSDGEYSSDSVGGSKYLIRRSRSRRHIERHPVEGFP